MEQIETPFVAPLTVLFPQRAESTTKEWFLKHAPFLKSLLMGQFISVVLATAGMSAASLSDRGVNLPTLCNMCGYLLLSIFLLGIRRPLALPLWRYALFAVVDVEANFITLLSYRFTTITSVMLLDCFTIPVAMTLSTLFMAVVYTRRHMVGVLLCTVGMAFVVLSDLQTSANDNSVSATGKRALLGDALCLVGATIYGVSNVMQESIVKSHSRIELLGMTGAFGAVLSGLQLLVLEWDDVINTHFTPVILAFMGMYSLSVFTFYFTTSRFLQIGDATLFNLSILTSDVYAIFFAYIVEKARLHWLYFVALGTIVCGLIVYHRERAPGAVKGSAVSALSPQIKRRSTSDAPHIYANLSPETCFDGPHMRSPTRYISLRGGSSKSIDAVLL